MLFKRLNSNHRGSSPFHLAIIIWTLSSISSYASQTNDFLGKHFYVDATVKELRNDVLQQKTNTAVFDLFTHGKPGELFIENKWRNSKEIVSWLQQGNKLDTETHLEYLWM